MKGERCGRKRERCVGGRSRQGAKGKTGGGVLDVSIRPGAVRFSTGKVATVGLARGEGGGRAKRRSSPSSGAGGRGSETLRGLFSYPSSFLYLPLFVAGTHEKISPFFPRNTVIFFRMLATL